MSELISLIYPIVAAVFVASYLFVSKQTGSSPESFDLVKFASTLIVGGGIAVLFYVTGSPISADAVEVQILAYSALVVIVEKGIKIVVRTAVKVNISGFAPFLPKVPVAAVPVAVAAPVAAVSAPVNSPGVGATGDHHYILSGDGVDTVDKIAVKFYPAIIQGVSPLPVEVFVVADPAAGPHQVVKGVIDWKDGTPCEEFVFKNGVAQLRHTYEYRQAGTLVAGEPSPYYAREFYPALTATSRDGLICSINNEAGRSLIVTVKDAEAVRLGKVTNFPAPQ